MRLFINLTLATCLWLTTPVYAQHDVSAAIAAFEQGDFDTASQLFSEHQQQVQAKIYLARLSQNSDLDDAEDWIEKAIEQAPDNAEAHFFRGQIMGAQASNSLMSAMSYAKKSKTSFAKAVELAPNQVKYRRGLMQFYLQAPGFAGGDPALAKQQAQAIAKLDPVAGAQAEISIARTDDNPNALQAKLTEAKKQFPERAEFYFSAGMAAQSEDDYATAISEFKQAQQANSNEPASQLAKYHALYQTGRTAVLSEQYLEQGQQALIRYLEQAPKHADLPETYWAKFRLANLYQLTGNNKQAKQIYQALREVKNKELQKRLKKRLRKLKRS